MQISRESRTEASMPAATRVDIRVLVDLVMYWESQDVRITSVSQLISWSLEMFGKVLENNKVIGRQIESVEEAQQVLWDRGLVQKSLASRSQKKMMMARGFENLRYEGIDPREYASTAYKIMHNSYSVKPFEGSDMRVKEPAVGKELSIQEELAIREMEERKRKGDLDEEYVPGKISGSVLGDYEMFKPVWALKDQERKEREGKARRLVEGEKVAPQSLVRRPYDTSGLERDSRDSEKRPVGRPRKADSDSGVARTKSKEEMDIAEMEFAEREVKKMRELREMPVRPPQPPQQLEKKEE